MWLQHAHFQKHENDVQDRRSYLKTSQWLSSKLIYCEGVVLKNIFTRKQLWCSTYVAASEAVSLAMAASLEHGRPKCCWYVDKRIDGSI